jgi:collagen type VI alpha
MRTIVQGFNFKFNRMRVAYVTFAGDASVRFGLGQYSTSEDLLNAITIESFQPGTNLAHALNTVQTQVFTTSNFRPGVERICVLLSDGKATIDVDQAVLAAAELKGSGVTLYAVSTGPTVNDELMVQLASHPAPLYTARVMTRNDVSQQAVIFLDAICQ